LQVFIQRHCAKLGIKEISSVRGFQFAVCI